MSACPRVCVHVYVCARVYVCVRVHVCVSSHGCWRVRECACTIIGADACPIGCLRVFWGALSTPRHDCLPVECRGAVAQFAGPCTFRDRVTSLSCACCRGASLGHPTPCHLRDYELEQEQALARAREREASGEIRQCNEGRWTFSMVDDDGEGNIKVCAEAGWVAVTQLPLLSSAPC